MKTLLQSRYLNNFASVLLIANFLFPFTVVKAQLVVPTTPQAKNFLIERGSGIACCSCPSITDKCMAVIHSYSAGKGSFMVYHFGPDARPQSGQLNKDYRTPFGDSILTPVWPFYLNMMVNRKDQGPPYGSTFVFGTTDQVTPECNSTSAETAPVNLAISSSYNSSTRVITVNVKAYYTSNSATSKNYLQIALTEDSIVGPQCVNSAPFIYDYLHMDMFRANINGPIGATVSTTTTGTTFTDTYTYILPAKFGTGTDQTAWVAPNTNHLKLVMFMTEDLNGFNTKFGKIQNVITAPLGKMMISGLQEIAIDAHLNVFPNPSKGHVQISSDVPVEGYELINMNGQTVISKTNIHLENIEADFPDVSKGFYMIRLATEHGTILRRIILHD